MGGGLEVDKATRSGQLWRLGVIGLVTVAAFALRAFVESDPGPLFIIAVLLAAYWFGRWGGLVAGVVETAAFLAARAVNPPDMGSSAFASGALRLVVYCATGYAVGWLVEDRLQLRKRVSESERHMAELRAMQEALTPPELPTRPSLELASVYVPAEGGVAGDFFLVEPGPQDSTIVVVGDVAGKGLVAARRAAFVRMAMVAAAPFEDNPCKLLALANSNLIERAGVSDVFVTCACIVIKPAEHKLTFALAGHPPLLALDDGRVLNGVKQAFPLGIGVDIDCELGELDFAPGTGFVAYTDGLTEARRSGAELFGQQRAVDILRGLRDTAPSAALEELRRAAERFANGALPDDLCMVAVRAAP
jgi:serine phosphatase RsbU (regulator of sigma subunit)